MARERASKKKRFSRKGVSANTLTKRSEQSGFGDRVSMVKDGITIFRVPDGDTTIRVMPPLWGDSSSHYAVDVFVHYSMGAAGRDAYICPSKTGKGHCPICEEQQAQYDAGNEERAKELRPSKRAAFYLVDRDNEEDGVQLWMAPWTMDKEMCQLSVDKRTGEVYWLDDADEGYDFSFNKSGKGIGTKYSGAALSRRTSSIAEEFLDWVEEHPLPDQLIFYSESELRAAAGIKDPGDAVTTRPGVVETPKTWKEVVALSEDDLLDLCQEKGIPVETDDIENLQEKVADELGL